MKIIIVKAWLLKFDTSIPIISYKIELPLLIDNRNNVLVGNSLRAYFDPLDDVKCIVDYNNDEFARSVFAGIELYFATENSFERIKNIETQLKKYINSFNRTFESISLFEIEQEKRWVTKDNYDKPPVYNFVKKKKKNGDDEEDDDIFSDDGEFEYN